MLDGPSGARAVLREVFGHGDFRAGQGEAVDAVVGGGDAVVLLPTGAGKSLCFQVPAVVAFRGGRGTTIVISPLIALMNDQVDALTGRGIAAAAIHSHQDDDDQRAVVGSFLRGELALLYVSPERAALDSFHRMLRRVPIALLAIDEAHCVSQWGHDFRPEYLQLARLREVVDAPVIALTATATPRVMDEIIGSLELRAPVVVRGDFRRPNLAFEVEHHRSDATRIDAVVGALDAAGLRARSGGGRAIIYCSTRKKTETVAAALKSAGFAAGHYHAGRTALARERAHKTFAVGRTRILVATSAFGMGIDHPDVRLIVHFQAPGSLEAYYQEAGRAGRDGEPARCLMLFGIADLMTQRKLQSGGGGSAARSEQALAAIERYAGARRCRQQILCAHFAGPGSSDDQEACGLCDACRDPDAVGEAARSSTAAEREVAASLGGEARQVILDAVGHLRRPVGKGNLAKALRGSKAREMATSGLLQLPEYGRLAEDSEGAIIATIEQLIVERKLARRGQKYPTVWLPGRSVGAMGKGRGTSRTTSGIARELDSYRRRMARELKWKSYMVFQRRTMAAIEQQRPASKDALARIPGLGPAKIERFGDDILAVVRRHAAELRA